MDPDSPGALGPVNAGPDEVACAVCAQPLILLSDVPEPDRPDLGGPGEPVAWLHTQEAPGGRSVFGPVDHPAVPVRREEVRAVLRCDLCLGPNPGWLVPTTAFVKNASGLAMPGGPPLSGAVQASAADMLACEPCARLVRKDRWDDLEHRVVLALAATHGLSPAEPLLIAEVRRLHAQIRAHRNGPVRRRG